MSAEAAFGAAWRALALSEGHVAAMPMPIRPRPDPEVVETQNERHMRQAQERRNRVLALSGHGLRHCDIARMVGITRGRVSQIITEAKREQV